MKKENHFEYLLQNLSDWVWQVDMEKMFIQNNGKLFKLLGYQPNELENTDISNIVDKRDKKLIINSIEYCINNGKPVFNLPILFIAKSYKIIPMEISFGQILDLEQNITGVLGISKDLRFQKFNERKMMLLMLKTEEKERERLAMEIHDGVGPMLSGINLYTSTLLTNGLSDELQKDLILKVKQTVLEASAELKQIANNLIPVEFINRTLAENIEITCKRMLFYSGIKLVLRTSAYDAILPYDINLMAYRIIIELLNNSIKHSGAKTINISLANDAKEICVRFKDNGVGFNLENNVKSDTGLGIRNILSRLKILDAVYSFRSKPGKGMSLSFSFVSNEQPECFSNK